MKWAKQFKEMLFPLNSENLRIDAAFALKENHLPKSIFKYRDGEDNSIKNLEDDTIWLADPSNLNDPYDCAHTINFNEIQKSQSKQIATGYLAKTNATKPFSEKEKSFILSSPNPFGEMQNILLSRMNASDSQKKAINLMMKKAYKDMSESFSSKLSNGFKLCSFSERNDSILMWAHYSYYHQGFCIEYDIEGRNSANPDYVKRFLYPVIYSKKILDITEHINKGVDDKQFNNLFPSLAALIKAKEWSYEKEWRLVFSNHIIPKEQPYRIGNPKAIYLGAKIKKDKQKQIIEICDRKKIPVYKMETSHKRFALKPIPIKNADIKVFK